MFNVLLDRLSDVVVGAAGCSTSPAGVVVIIRRVDGAQRHQLLVRRVLHRSRSLSTDRHRLSHLQRLQLVVQVSESVTVTRTSKSVACTHAVTTARSCRLDVYTDI